MLQRLFIIALTVLMLPAMAEGKKRRTSSDALKQKQRTEQQQARTAKDLRVTEVELAAGLRRVTTLEEQIEAATRRCDSLTARVTALNAQIRLLEDSIAANQTELDNLKQAYIGAVRSARKNRRELNALTFIFSAHTFRQAYRRVHYLQEFSEWRKRKAERIAELTAQLTARRERLELLSRQTQSLQSQAAAEERKLRADRKALQSEVATLEKKQKQLNNMLRKQQNTLNDLNKEIDRLIEEEAAEQRRREEAARKRREKEEAERKKREQQQQKQKKQQKQQPAASQQPSKKPENTPPAEFTPQNETPKPAAGKFGDQKGKLPSPLSHTYVVAQGFGVQTHRSIKTVKVNNTGVDLETALGATARAVYAGEVTRVFMQSGLHYVVLIRHGEYITVYANLESISVKKGDKVNPGTVIGTVAPSPVNADRGQLHFEIRRERDKYDPALWLKR